VTPSRTLVVTCPDAVRGTACGAQYLAPRRHTPRRQQGASPEELVSAWRIWAGDASANGGRPGSGGSAAAAITPRTVAGAVTHVNRAASAAG
jgi:hypothetical protein